MEKDLELLSAQIKDILKEKNPLKQLVTLKELEKEYKQTNFYKQYKMNIIDVFNFCRENEKFTGEAILNKIQYIIDNLSLENISHILDQANVLFEKENEEVLESLEQFKGILGK